MDNFDLKKYLAEGRLLKEEIMVDTTIMMGGDEYLNDMFSRPEEYGVEEDEIEFVKNVISTPKMPASKFLDVFDDYWVNIIQEPGGDAAHIEQGLEDHVKGGMLSPEEAAQVMIMYWDPDGTDYGDEEKEATLKQFQNLAEGKLLKEEVDVLGNEFLQDIQDTMKMYYKMDVDMDDIKDWVNMYYIDYNSEYDEGPGDVDYEGNEFGSEDYESEKKELVFDTAEREDFYMHLNPDAESTFPNL